MNDKIRYLIYAFFTYALLISLFYLTTVVSTITDGHGELYNTISTLTFIIVCIIVCLSIFLNLRIKQLCLIPFFFLVIIISFNDPKVNAILYSDSGGWEFIENLIFFSLGYVLSFVGIIVCAGDLLLSKFGKKGRVSKKKGGSD